MRKSLISFERQKRKQNHLSIDYSDEKQNIDDQTIVSEHESLLLMRLARYLWMRLTNASLEVT
jgi:hypothetical protein